MSKLKEFKVRIDSVKKTRKMTQAMKMVAAAKFKRASEKAIKFRSYQSHFEDLVKLVQKSDIDLPILKKNSSKNPLNIAIVISSDRGLCGGFNSNVLKFAFNKLNGNTKTDLYIYGRKAIQFFKTKPWPIQKKEEGFTGRLTLENIKKELEPLVDKYIAGEINSIKIYYNEFGTALSSKLMEKQILPIENSDTDSVNLEKDDFFLEPSPEAISKKVVNEYLVNTLYSAFLESNAAEQGARMAAMDSATNNAGEMIQALTLLYNRQRQAIITTELSEIVAGGEALLQ
ncbi:ATP synthase F1 subunit gamma [Candidatus Marinamargulisbacteria bacterium SCGC AG-410-N11]|nr:ATP synthase F1 subunit gamma [Candidatus Marinamargulisbacteria bacterium SCGC AG-410-N11]